MLGIFLLYGSSLLPQDGIMPEREDMAVRRGVALGRWLVRKV